MKWIFALLLVSIVALYGCATQELPPGQSGGQAPVEKKEQSQSPGSEPVVDVQITDSPAWFAMELTDVRTKERFTIGQFDKPVLLESFAVWCPTCKRQQNEVKMLHEDIGNAAISIGLNTDPNEDAAKVEEYINQNEFDWRYAVSPTEFTQLLIDEFGTGVVNAPSAPMILVCPDNSYEQLPRGVKSDKDLKGFIEGCS